VINDVGDVDRDVFAVTDQVADGIDDFADVIVPRIPI